MTVKELLSFMDSDCSVCVDNTTYWCGREAIKECGNRTVTYWYPSAYQETTYSDPPEWCDPEVEIVIRTL